MYSRQSCGWRLQLLSMARAAIVDMSGSAGTGGVPFSRWARSLLTHKRTPRRYEAGEISSAVLRVSGQFVFGLGGLPHQRLRSPMALVDGASGNQAGKCCLAIQ